MKLVRFQTESRALPSKMAAGRSEGAGRCQKCESWLDRIREDGEPRLWCEKCQTSIPATRENVTAFELVDTGAGRDHAAEYDARLLTVSGSTAVYLVVDTAAPGYNPCIPSCAIWTYEHPKFASMFRSEKDYAASMDQLDWRRRRTERTIEQNLRPILSRIGRIGGMWRVIEDVPEADQVDCSVEIYIPSHCASPARIPVVSDGECFSAYPMLSGLIGRRK